MNATWSSLQGVSGQVYVLMERGMNATASKAMQVGGVEQGEVDLLSGTGGWE